MTCLACGFKGNEPGDHRCARCGRRLDGAAPGAPPPASPPAITAAAAPALAPVPEWKQEVNQRLEDFRHRRAQQQKLFEEENSEVVPAVDLEKKILAFEDFAASFIMPVIVDRSETPPPPQVKAPAPKPVPAPPPKSAAAPKAPPLAKYPPPKAPPPLQAPPPPEAAPRALPPLAGRDVRCAEPVAPVFLRGVAGVLDACVMTVAIGLFVWVFYEMLDGFPTQARALAGFAGAGAVVTAFYVFIYIYYAAATPGMQWTGLRLLDYEGNPARPGQRLIRALGSLLSAAALGLGYLWALVDEEGLTWHDRMSQTFLSRDEHAARRFQPR